MLRRSLAALAIAVLALALQAQGSTRQVLCYFITEEGASAEGNALMQRFMGVEPALLRGYAPMSFAKVKDVYSFKVEGEFGYSAEATREVERYGRVVLKSVKAEIRAPEPPRAAKTQLVTLKVADLAAQRGVVQPAQAAVEAAARKLKLKKGVAWIVSMELAAPGLLKAAVGFAK